MQSRDRSRVCPGSFPGYSIHSYVLLNWMDAMICILNYKLLFKIDKAVKKSQSNDESSRKKRFLVIGSCISKAEK